MSRLPKVAHDVFSRQHGNLLAFGAKRTSGTCLAGGLGSSTIASTRNQVELLQIDTTASENLPGFRHWESRRDRSKTNSTRYSAKANNEFRYRDYAHRFALAPTERLGGCDAGAVRSGRPIFCRFFASRWGGRACVARLSIVVRVQEPDLAFADRLILETNPAVQASRRMRLPANYLYVHTN
jgi:hypothetical protein